ncbi:DUF5658 family protein [Calycomorphotria hydatis]|nr:DUF5658 family protein [Calycomorphotria hydatis]
MTQSRSNPQRLRRKIATPRPPDPPSSEASDYQVREPVRIARETDPLGRDQEDLDVVAKYADRWSPKLEPLWRLEVRHAGLIRIYLLVSLADLVMTYFLLRTGSFHEANPIARWFLYGWGIRGMVYYKFTLVAIVCAISQFVARQREELGRFVLQVGIAVTFGVVCYGLTLLYRHLG